MKAFWTLGIAQSTSKLQWAMAEAPARCGVLGPDVARAGLLEDLCITELPSHNTLPGGNTGLRLPAPPAGAFTIWVCWYLWLLLKFCSDFTTRHLRPPRPALPSFRVEMALCRGLLEVLTAPHSAQPMTPKRHGYKITDLFQNLIA